MKAYKIFDEGFDPKTGTHYPKTLFHGLHGSRRLPVEVLMQAQKKPVTDGSGQQAYISGFHAYASLDDVRNWLKGAKRASGRVVVEVEISECRSKPRAVRATLLANVMIITAAAWAKREPAIKYADPTKQYT